MDAKNILCKTAVKYVKMQLSVCRTKQAARCLKRGG